MGNAEGLWEKGRVIPMWRVWKDEAGMRWGNGRQTECIYVWGGKTGSLLSDSLALS